MSYQVFNDMLSLKLSVEEKEYLKGRHAIDIDLSKNSFKVIFYNLHITFPNLFVPNKMTGRYDCNFHFIKPEGNLELNFRKYLLDKENCIYNNFYILSKVYEFFNNLKIDILGQGKIKDGDDPKYSKYSTFENTYFLSGYSKIEETGKEKMFKVFNIDNINIVNNSYVQVLMESSTDSFNKRKGLIKSGDSVNVEILFLLGERQSKIYFGSYLKKLAVIKETDNLYTNTISNDEDDIESLADNYNDSIKGTDLYSKISSNPLYNKQIGGNRVKQRDFIGGVEDEFNGKKVNDGFKVEEEDDDEVPF